jgi:hypothetical protein
MVSFLALGSAFVLHGFLARMEKKVLWPATVALVLALGVSGSRSAILYVGIVALAAGLACVGHPEWLRRAAAPLAGAALAYGVLRFFPDFRTGLSVDRTRFNSAGGLQEGILYRWLSDMQLAWQSIWSAPLVGEGLGIGTNVGAGLVTGTRQFLLAEGEWARVILESGPLLGLAFIALRVGLAGRMLRVARGALREHDDALPMLLLGAAIMDMLFGQWGQSTASGFAVLTTGLCFAAGENEEAEAEAAPAEDAPPAPRKRRGRAIHAAAIGERRP